jgi:hypothetical protein
MLSRYFEQPWRIGEIRRNCAGMPIDEFAEQLFQRGYSGVAARRHIRSAEHITHWAADRGITVPDLDAPALKRFGSHLSRCRCGRYFRAVPIHVIAGARLFLSHIQGIVSLVSPLCWLRSMPSRLRSQQCSPLQHNLKRRENSSRDIRARSFEEDSTWVARLRTLMKGNSGSASPFAAPVTRCRAS